MTNPSEEYTIHVLTDKEYELLPYPGAKDSLGMTVVDKKTAYIRQTNVHDLDMGTISHEFDELMAKVSPHEINGIRYKGFKDVIRSIFNAVIPTLGSSIFGSPKPPVQEVKFSGFNPQQATSAFSPQQGPQTPSPLSDIDFNQGLSNISSNRQNQTQSVFSNFRGLGTRQQNTAFNNALTNVDTSADKSRQQFISDQDERKRIAGL